MTDQVNYMGKGSLKDRLDIPMTFRKPEATERAKYEQDHEVSAYFDVLLGLALPSLSEFPHDRIWLVGENSHYGFPDPPQFAFFVLCDGEKVLHGTNLDTLPQHWRGLKMKAEEA